MQPMWAYIGHVEHGWTSSARLPSSLLSQQMTQASALSATSAPDGIRGNSVGPGSDDEVARKWPGSDDEVARKLPGSDDEAARKLPGSDDEAAAVLGGIVTADASLSESSRAIAYGYGTSRV